MTAVEFIRQEFLEKITNENYNKSFDEIIEQAKEMEKEQIRNAYENGVGTIDYGYGLEYYNETFLNKQNENSK